MYKDGRKKFFKNISELLKFETQAEFLKRREEILVAGATDSLGRYKNSTDIFLSIDGAIEVAVRSSSSLILKYKNTYI